MITFLWMLYLAFTLIISIFSLIVIIMLFKLFQHNLEDSDLYLTMIGIAISCVMWSIWYMYFLN